MKDQRYRFVNIVYLITLVVILSSDLWIGKIGSDQLLRMVISQVLLFFPTLVYLIITRQSYTRSIHLKKLSLQNVFLLILFSICMIAVTSFISAFTELFVKDSISGVVTQIVEQRPWWLALLCIAGLPAIAEESVYRGIFYQEYRKLAPRSAIILSALLFGLMHGNLGQFSYAFIMGIIFSLMIEATDTILSTMIIHFIINGSSVILMYVYPDLVANSSQDVPMSIGMVFQYYGVRAFLMGIVGFFIYQKIAKNCGRWEMVCNLFREKREKGSFGQLMTIPLLIAIAILIEIIISNELMP